MTWTLGSMEWPSGTSTLAANLIAAFPDIPVRWNVPNPRPDVLLVVRRVGTVPSIGVLDVAVLDVEVWSGKAGDSPKPAEVLATKVREAIRQLPVTAPDVTQSKITGHRFIADAESGAPRVILTCEIALQGQPA